MERLTRMIGAMGLAAALLIATSVPALATTYTPVNGTSCQFTKYLIMDAGDTVPNVTFSFTVAPGTPISADTAGSKMEVMAGVGSPTIADISFSNTDTTSTTAGPTDIDVQRLASERASGLTATTGVEFNASEGEKFATKTATVNFSAVNFSQPGIYRYIITETANAAHEAAGIMHDNDVDRVLDVYVTDNGSGTLVVSSYVMHLTASDVTLNTTMGSSTPTPSSDLTDKTDGFTNEYNTKDLKFHKEVSGNQASRKKFFEFTVTCTNVTDADSFVVSLSDDSNANTTDGNASAVSGAAETGGTIAANANKTNPTTVTGADLKAGQRFYLQHGQNIVIRGLPKNATYTVTENKEDYKSEALSGKTNTGVIGTVASANKIAEAGYLNTRNGVIPTGVFLYAGIGVVLVVLAILGFVFTRKNRKRFTD